MSKIDKALYELIGAIIATIVIGGIWISHKNPLQKGVAIAHPTVHMHSYGPMIQTITHDKLHLVSTFTGPYSGLTGLIVATQSGQKLIAWGLGDRFIVPGPIISEDGTNWTEKEAALHSLLPKPIPVPADLSQKMMAAPGFVLGKSGPMITAFLDPNCIFCHKFWDQVEPLAVAGKIRVKVVPVGFLKPSSMPKAITILMSKNPVAAWAANEKGFDVATEEGATVPAKVLSKKVEAEILYR